MFSVLELCDVSTNLNQVALTSPEPCRTLELRFFDSMPSVQFNVKKINGLLWYNLKYMIYSNSSRFEFYDKFCLDLMVCVAQK